MRRADWVDRLWQTIETHQALPFRWAGKGDAHDCCTFAADCVDAMTGTNYVDLLLAHYRDEPSARAYIEAGGGLRNVISSFLGDPKRISFMNRGDVVIVDDRGTEVVGVCVGRDVLAAHERGLGRYEANLVITCWGV